ncbi:NAD(P)/FAD-dependent oxidoreductase, partial [Sinorhizobium fredii]
TPECALTRRLDGSYTLASSGRAMLDITPQGIRYARWFMPMFMKRLKAVQFGIGKSFLQGPEAFGSLNKSKPSAFERMRVLDPPPSRRTIAAILKRVTEQFPALAGVEVADSWGAYVDFTPDAVPVISPADGVRGLYLAAGCSGHGFGLGPGIGRLAADLVANDTPCVDPTPFRLSRLLDGSKVKVGAI